MSRNYLLLVSFILCNLIAGYSQEIKPISGRIAALDETFLAGAHVINLNLRLGTTTNDSGYFELPAKPGDSLFLSFIGYSPRLLVIPDSPGESDMLLYLVPLSVDLKGVTVYALPKSFLEFKRLFSNLKLPADSTHTFHIPPLDFIGQIPSGGFGITISGPLQALYDLYSKEGRQKQKLKELISHDELEAIRTARYNPQVVMMLTGLTDAESIKRFMQFCYISNYQLLRSNDYELYVTILNCYKEFDKTN